MGERNGQVGENPARPALLPPRAPSSSEVGASLTCHLPPWTWCLWTVCPRGRSAPHSPVHGGYWGAPWHSLSLASSHPHPSPALHARVQIPAALRAQFKQFLPPPISTKGRKEAERRGEAIKLGQDLGSFSSAGCPHPWQAAPQQVHTIPGSSSCPSVCRPRVCAVWGSGSRGEPGCGAPRCGAGCPSVLQTRLKGSPGVQPCERRDNAGAAVLHLS